jgi:hypothetical protein
MGTFGFLRSHMQIPDSSSAVTCNKDKLLIMLTKTRSSKDISYAIRNNVKKLSMHCNIQ